MISLNFTVFSMSTFPAFTQCNVAFLTMSEFLKIDYNLLVFHNMFSPFFFTECLPITT